MIDKAVLLAAGRGTRLGALTESVPKPLLTVGGRPIIVRILDGLARAGITDVLIVTGHLGDELQYELGNGAESGLRVQYARQEQLEGTGRAVALARDFVGDERFFAGLGDIIVRPENYRRILRAANLADAVVAVNETDDPSEGAAVYVREDGTVERVVEKPPPGTAGTRWNQAGLFVFGPELWPAVDALQPSPRGEYELTDAVAALAASGLRIAAMPIEGPWFDTGTPESLAAARAEFAR